MLALDVRSTSAIPAESTWAPAPAPPGISAPIPRRVVKRESSLLDNLDSSDDDAYEPGPSTSKRSTPSRPPSRTEKKFKCTYEGCDKAYFKPSRLVEHQLTHTGERPHKCTECDQTYLRASHLTAHQRTHRSEGDKPFACPVEDCGKRFWTSTHLSRHMTLHKRTPSFECPTCGETFHKARQLRDHNVMAHMPPGTKPYPCPHDGCEWSFALHHQLKNHLKTHNDTRYTCSHPDHGSETPTFSTWSAFQTHIHDAHPPTCPFEECSGRTFKTHARLKEHLKVHEEQSEALAAGQNTILSDPPEHGENSVTSNPKGKRRMSEAQSGPSRTAKLQRITGSTEGKDFKCEEEGCVKAFKTKYSLQSHISAAHLLEKPYKCHREGCSQAFARKSILQRHIATHDKPKKPSSRQSSTVSSLTGKSYTERQYSCPSALIHQRMTGQEIEGCNERFGRMYDLSRHLQSAHDLTLADEELAMLLESPEKAQIVAPMEDEEKLVKIESSS